MKKTKRKKKNWGRNGKKTNIKTKTIREVRKEKTKFYLRRQKLKDCEIKTRWESLDKVLLTFFFLAEIKLSRELRENKKFKELLKSF